MTRLMNEWITKLVWPFVSLLSWLGAFCARRAQLWFSSFRLFVYEAVFGGCSHTVPKYAGRQYFEKVYNSVVSKLPQKRGMFIAISSTSRSRKDEIVGRKNRDVGLPGTLQCRCYFGRGKIRLIEHTQLLLGLMFLTINSE